MVSIRKKTFSSTRGNVTKTRIFHPMSYFKRFFALLALKCKKNDLGDRIFFFKKDIFSACWSPKAAAADKGGKKHMHHTPEWPKRKIQRRRNGCKLPLRKKALHLNGQKKIFPFKREDCLWTILFNEHFLKIFEGKFSFLFFFYGMRTKN